MKNYYSFFAIILALSIAGTVAAQDVTNLLPSTTSAPKPMPRPTAVKQDALMEKRETIQEKKVQWQETNASLREQAAEKRDAAFEEIKEKRTDFVEQAKTLRADLAEKRETTVGNLKESRAALEAQIKERREALKQEIQEIKKERLSVRKTFVENRLDAVIKAVEANQERLSTKIAELEEKGYDLHEASDHVDASEESLSKAKSLLTSLKELTVSDESEASATKPRELAKQIESLIKESRDHLLEAIKAIHAVVTPSADEDTDAAAVNN